jgi:hypothetical protein
MPHVLLMQHRLFGSPGVAGGKNTGTHQRYRSRIIAAILLVLSFRQLVSHNRLLLTSL